MDEDRFPGLSSGPAPGSIHELARKYKERYPWGDLEAMEITMRLFAIAVSQKAAQSRFFRARGVERSLARYTILRILFFSDGRPISQKDISDQTHATQANVTYLIGVLEGEGLVERVQDEEDRRFSYVRLTPEGHELAATLVPIQVEFMTAALRGFTSDEKQEFIRLIEKYHQESESSALDD